MLHARTIHVARLALVIVGALFRAEFVLETSVLAFADAVKGLVRSNIRHVCSVHIIFIPVPAHKPRDGDFTSCI